MKIEADIEKSKLRFWHNYNVLINQSPDAPPIRYIFFTWPADKIKGQMRDVNAKATVCDYHAYYLATLLSQMREFKFVSLSGYSYGSRMALDALHILGGGCKNGRNPSGFDDFARAKNPRSIYRNCHAKPMPTQWWTLHFGLSNPRSCYAIKQFQRQNPSSLQATSAERQESDRT